MIKCTFTGHRDVYGIRVSDIVKILEELLHENGEMECFVGGMGQFDILCASAVRALRAKYREKKISLILVLPYMQKRINDNKDYYEQMYDLILIPDELSDMHYKRAIPARNRWMVDKADCVIAMVWREHGGAYTTLQYAEKRGKRIIRMNG